MLSPGVPSSLSPPGARRTTKQRGSFEHGAARPPKPALVGGGLGAAGLNCLTQLGVSHVGYLLGDSVQA